MKRRGMLIAVMAASLTLTGAAQQAQTGQGSKDTKNQTTTVTGCLSNAVAAGTTASGTAGTSGQTKGNEQQFLLTNASIGAGSDKTATAGTSGTGTTYRLTGGNRDELQKFLNSRVEIRGTLQPRAENPSGGRATATGKEKPEQAADPANMQTLRVTAVKQISPTCEAR